MLSNLIGNAVKFTHHGTVSIRAERHRSQARNRVDALERLIELIAKAAVRPRPRVKTRPSLGAKRRRVDAKTRRGTVKSLRSRPDEE